MRAIGNRVRALVPTRETIHRHRLLRPFADHLGQPDLWRMSRRSVPRGVALGIGIGIFVPFMHTIVAVLLAIPTRANVAIAAAATLVVNPLTIGPLYWAAYRIGAWELDRSSAVDPVAAHHVSSATGNLLWWAAHAWQPIGLGLMTIAVSAALIGYGGSSIVWRRRTMSRYRARPAAGERPLS